MEIILASLAFVAAGICAGVMGFANQRGTICTAAAMEELLSSRTYLRLAALVEASAWVAGGLVIAEALGLLGRKPAGYALTVWTVVGGALLGLGAALNRACMIGTITRFGSGNWAYLVTPLGFFAGCVTFPRIFALPKPQPLPDGSPVLQAAAWLAWGVTALMLWRVARLAFAARNRGVRNGFGRWSRVLGKFVWSPHAAAMVIAIASLCLLLLIGAWSYTEALANLAGAMESNLVAKALLLLARLSGAALGGWTAGRFPAIRLSPAQTTRCFVGGLVMAWGALLVPGGNDGLVLVGMPLLWPYAWVAFLAMCLSIALARLAEPRWQRV